ncbi:hypothetical protein OIU80_15510 [Flavobacterium sp. LS1R47]|jgi:hypothetical protein|uniref:Uncharacterized protein n=1 Tax=Flavobacterium frigoritolerans TaxID=2987686 RepID=A0A9X2ZQA7_9FLAO|nr:hypothetical protein [Flavobacterium frigoritolerans]MCV9933690.1 hypothetical protein [Flavobacterium frigoritolerans]
MNSKIFISSLIISSILFISCKKELEPQESTPTSELVKLGLAQDTTKANSAVQTPATTTNPNTVMGATGGINPAHGQPGHRCDIEVGAPLNSAAPAQTVQQTTTQTAPTTTVVTNTATAQPTTTTAKGMNPPHGQKGHRCDIAVGAPLNSAAPKATTQQTQSESGTVSQQMAIPLPAPNTDVTAPGMNPPHGQEGHRCDIAVGAALPKS